MEQIYKEPYMVQIYDIVSDTWIKDMRRAAMPTLQRAPPPNSPGATPRTAIYACKIKKETQLVFFAMNTLH